MGTHGWRSWQSGPTSPGQIAATVSLGILCGLGFATFVPRLPDDELELGVLTLALLFAGACLVAAKPLARGDWFHPLAFPLLYVAICSSLPILYIDWFDRSLQNPGVSPFDLTPSLPVVFGLTIIALAAGIGIGLRLPRLTGFVRDQAVDFDLVLMVARTVLMIAIGARLYLLVITFGLPYGTGSIELGALEAMSNISLFAGTVLAVIANVRLHRRVLGTADAVLLVVFAVVTLLAGSRGDLLAPVLFILFCHHAYVRRLRTSTILLSFVAVLVVFQGVSGTRQGEPFAVDAQTAVERSLGSLATPLQVQTLLMERVPSSEPYLGGSTYVASLIRQVPGPVANSILGQPDDTASFEFRRIENTLDPNFGLGFSLPSEGYLNFGIPGVAAAVLLAGLILGWAYRQQTPVPSRPIHVLYPILVAALPLGFRSDALEQVKVVLYPMVLLAITLYFARRTASRGTMT